jgi:DNA-directed RNA polymerase subunit M/transcription elongation factor TFIIS
MNAYESSRQEGNDDEPTKSERRAEWEGFEFRVPAEGAVRIENVSYGDESGEHVYVVSVEDGIPFDCTCPAWKYHTPDGGCKHMKAVENRPAVTRAASMTNSQQVATDGGQPVEDDESAETNEQDDDGADCPECGAEGTVQREPQAGSDTIPTYVCSNCRYSTLTY